MGLLSRRLFVKVSEHSENEQSLTHVLGRVFETLADGGYLEGAFSGSSVSTLVKGLVGGARPPKDTEKGVFRARKGAFPRGSKAGEDNSEKPYSFERLYPSSNAQRDVWAESQPCYSQAARMKRDVSGLSSFCTVRSETRQAIAP